MTGALCTAARGPLERVLQPVPAGQCRETGRRCPIDVRGPLRVRGIAGFGAGGLTCRTPAGIADALGYLRREEDDVTRMTAEEPWRVRRRGMCWRGHPHGDSPVQ